MVKNKVVLKERDAWSDLANFIGEMVAKICGSNGLGQFARSGSLSSREKNKTVACRIL